MSKKYLKIIKKWAKLKHPDPRVEKTAIKLYESLNITEKQLMLKEFKDYIDNVENGTIEASVPTIPIEVFKKDTTEQELKDYYNGH